MKQRSNIIAVEGICCAGKTTLLGSLQSALDAAIVPEATTLVSAFPPPPQNAIQARANEQFCLQVEVLRSYLAMRLGYDVTWVLLDRSYLSVLSIAYGYLPRFNDRNGFLELLHDCVQLLDSGQLLPPSVILYLDLPVELVSIRNLHRTEQLTEFWVDPKLLTRQQEFYKLWFQNVNSIPAFHLDATQEQDLVLHSALNAIASLENITEDRSTHINEMRVIYGELLSMPLSS